jgi:hypothetical protein
VQSVLKDTSILSFKSKKSSLTLSRQSSEVSSSSDSLTPVGRSSKINHKYNTGISNANFENP